LRARALANRANSKPRAATAASTTIRRAIGGPSKTAGARANAAQANTFEALPFFFVAVVVAHQFSVAQIFVDLLAIGWLLLRCVYVILYLADAAMPRTGVWIAAFVLNAALLLSPLWGR
jgi:uncharacterized MAPEG superfamily protein